MSSKRSSGGRLHDRLKQTLAAEVLGWGTLRGKDRSFLLAVGKEVKELEERDTWEVVWEKEVTSDANIVDGRFVSGIKKYRSAEEV